MHGKVCLITGANSGIGKVTALELARQGATVVMVCRNTAKGTAAQSEIRAASGNTAVDLLLADLSSLASVRELAEAFQQRYPRLDVLINNAGIYRGRYTETSDGFEQTFAVNHLAPFLLTNLLRELLIASAPARIITVSSEGHRWARMDFNDLHGKRGYNGMRAYTQSKLANILFTYELARQLAGTGVTANCLHPGGVATNFATEEAGLFGIIFRLMRPVLRTPEQGAATSVYLATAPTIADVTGTYFRNQRPARSSRTSYDQDTWQRLWLVSAELVGLPVLTADK